MMIKQIQMDGGRFNDVKEPKHEKQCWSIGTPCLSHTTGGAGMQNKDHDKHPTWYSTHWGTMDPPNPG